MPDLVLVKFQGGPCNGKTQLEGSRGLDGGLVGCEGALYRVVAGSGPPLVAQYEATVVQGGTAAYSGGGYRDLVQSVRRNLPANIAAASRVTSAAVRKASRRSKV